MHTMTDSLTFSRVTRDGHPAEFMHGTVRAYNQGQCRCNACYIAHKAQKIEHNRAVARGDTSRTLQDASKAAEHIRWLQSGGMGQATLCRAAGISTATLHRILRVPGSRCLGATINKIMAIQPDASYWVPIGGSRVRCRALGALGYTQADIAVRIGNTHPAINLHQTRDGKMTRAKALLILRVCQEIGDTPGPNEISRQRAMLKGYRVPADYDGDLFYDVMWDGTEPEPLELGDRRQAILEDADEIERQLREPSNPEERTLNQQLIAERLGVSWDYISRLRKNFGHALRKRNLRQQDRESAA